MSDIGVEHRVGEKRENNRILGGFYYTLRNIIGSEVETLCEPWGFALYQSSKASQIIQVPYEVWLQFALTKEGTGEIIQTTLEALSTVLDGK